MNVVFFPATTFASRKRIIKKNQIFGAAAQAILQTKLKTSQVKTM